MIAALLCVAALGAGAAAIRAQADDVRRDDGDARGRRQRPRPPGGVRSMTLLSATGGVGVGTLIAGPIGAVILGVGGGVAPRLVARRRAAKRDAEMEQQLLDLVVSLAATLRAGRSLEQALDAAAAEIPTPIGATVAAIADQVALGAPLDEALEVWAREVGTEESRLIAGVLRLQRRTGGALAGPLDELATTLRARRAAARELRSLTAQARLSAGILGLLPIGFFLFLSTVSRRDIEGAISTPAGAGAVAVGLVLQGIAFLWIRSLLRAGAR